MKATLKPYTTHGTKRLSTKRLQQQNLVIQILNKNIPVYALTRHMYFGFNYRILRIKRTHLLFTT